MSGVKVWHCGTSDGEVYGVGADTASDARRYLNDRLQRELAEDPTVGVRTIERTVYVGRDSAGSWSVGSVLLY